MEISATSTRGNIDDRAYDEFRQRMQRRFSEARTLFTTDAELWDAYLGSFPEETRQWHNCSACRHFIQRFGGLVTIGEDGRTESALWSAEDAPFDHAEAVDAMLAKIRRAKVTGVFLAKSADLGQAVTGQWTHFAVHATPYRNALLTAGQAMAAKREDFGTVQRALDEWSAPVIATALTLLRSDALYRSEKVLGQAEWLAKLHADIAGKNRANVVWRAIATAPAGFCHPRASMIGTLLDDIAAGLDFGDVSRKFKAKMHPLQYQRPTVAPSAGNIAAAEKIVADLGIAPALARRFARLEEVEAIWKPKAPEAPSGGVFGHLTPKGAATLPGMHVPAQKITFAKFRATVLPGAVTMELACPAVGNYSALVTAVNPDAPPILQWDTAERRNPVSTYVYNGGSRAETWGVHGWTAVTAVVLQPSMWGPKPMPHQAEGAIFVLAGARDSMILGKGNALFPEILKSELHAIRSTIEAYSKRATLDGVESASVCGLAIGKSNGAHVRVKDAAGGTMEYLVDRWD